MNRNHPFFAPLIDATPSRRTMLQTMALGAAAMLMSSFSRKSFADTPATSPSGAGSSGNGPIATTTYGKVRGFMDNGINVFKGIPYGDDTRKCRFQPPVPPPAWSDVMDTVAFGPAAPVAARAPSTNPSTNPSTQPARRREMVPPVQNENCLHLNIWTPAVGDGGKRPVMVYIHGGAYSSGTSNSDLYDGVNLCKQGDVVVVTMNHRLNIFGYLYLAEIGGPEYADSGNVGMLDLILMLQWVRDNIAEFGGDPGNILIYGQSGGGAKCATLMSMPAARGLFHRVITMSGQQITARETAAAMKSTQKVLDALKLTKNDIAKLNDLSVAELIGALSGQYFGPVLDGRSVARDPFSPDAPPLSADIPMILGNTHDETSMLLGNSDPTLFSITWDEVPAKLDKVIKQFMGKLTGAEVVADFRKMHPDYTPAQVFFGATTAFRSWRGQVIEAERRASKAARGRLMSISSTGARRTMAPGGPGIPTTSH